MSSSSEQDQVEASEVKEMVQNMGDWNEESRNTQDMQVEELEKRPKISVKQAKKTLQLNLLADDIFLTVRLLKLLSRLPHYGHEEEQASATSLSRVEAIFVARRVVKSMDRIKETEDDCPICWKNFGVARVTPCAHRFHSKCLLQWLADPCSEFRCPLCRSSFR